MMIKMMVIIDICYVPTMCQTNINSFSSHNNTRRLILLLHTLHRLGNGGLETVQQFIWDGALGAGIIHLLTVYSG